MSPFLFAIGMEYLSRCLASFKDNKSFGFHLKCKWVGIISLLFADDLLIFCKGDKASVGLIKEQLEIFSATSGLRANMEKSEVYLSGVEEEERNTICQILGMSQGSLPIRYLGVPFSHKKLTLSMLTAW